MRLTASRPVSPQPHSKSGSDGVQAAILDARVTHVRHGKTRYVLTHRMWYLRLPLDEMQRLPRPWLGYERAGIARLLDRDFGRGDRPLREWIDEALREGGQEPPGGRVDLVTLPRVAGLFFNPVSFWLCHDADGRLRAVLAEVNSTFGERHCYLCRKPDGGVIEAHDQIVARKLLYVSPFIPVEGEYRFRFRESPGHLGIFISLVQGGRTILFASIAGALCPLTSWSMAYRLLRQPLPAARVLLLIHVHAARLYLRGMRLVARVPNARPLVSVSRTTPVEDTCRPAPPIET